MMKLTFRAKGNERGMASFLVVSVIVTLLALVSVAFSHLSDREARQALDRQLSDQAYFAAESGLNDARAYLSSNPGAQSTSSCTPPSNGNPNPFVSSISGSDNVIRYSCVLIDSQPTELIYNLQPGQTVSFPVTINNLSTLYFSWENQTYQGSKQPLAANFGGLPQENTNNLSTDATGLLRVGIYPVPPGSKGNGHDTASDISAAARTYFMYPNTGDGSVGSIDYTNSALDGAFVRGNCNSATHPALPYSRATPRYCNSSVTKLQGAANTYYISLTAQYKPLAISIEAATPSGSPITITNVEARIDVTGAGNDVIRRIQAIVPTTLNTTVPNYGLQSMQAVCKLFRIPVDRLGHYGTPQLDSGAPNGDGLCNLPFSGDSISGDGIPPLESAPCPGGYTGNSSNCICPVNSSTNANGTCSCLYGGSWTFDSNNCSAPQPCPQNTTGAHQPNCSCVYGGSYPNCSGPPPPNCTSSAGGHRSGSNVYLDAGGGGCGYWYDSIVGWNGGFSGAGPINSNDNVCHTQQGGTDPWGWLSSATWCSGSYTPPPPPPSGGGGSSGGGGGGGSGGGGGGGGGGCGIRDIPTFHPDFGSMFYYGRFIFC